MTDYIYVDASYQRQNDVGSWAVVTEDKQYSGLIDAPNLHSFYCELYAVYQALLISKQYDDVVIYCDNRGVVKILNRETDEVTQFIDYSKKRDSNFLHKVYYLYQDNPHIKIRKIHRSENKIADRVARNMLYKGVYNK